jgi:hypothetical protein
VSNVERDRGATTQKSELPAAPRDTGRGRQIDIDFHFHLDTSLRSSDVMTDRIDVRTELAASRRMRVEIGEDGVLHVLAGPITLHLDRGSCEELTTTLARAMVTLARRQPPRRAPELRLVPAATIAGSDVCCDTAGLGEAAGASAEPVASYSRDAESPSAG